MPRNRPTGGNHVIRTCLFAALLVGSLSAPQATAQTAESYRQHAAELSRAKSWDDAITNYRKALELAPNDATTHYNLALALKYKGESREALKEFQSALKLRPKWADAHYGIGAVWYDLQDQAAAITELRTAEALDPLNAATHRLLARILAQHYNLALALHSQGDTGNAKKELDELSGLREFRTRLAQSKLLILQGVDALKKQKFDDALALFQKSAEQAPELPTSYYYLGLTWEG